MRNYSGRKEHDHGRIPSVLAAFCIVVDGFKTQDGGINTVQIGIYVLRGLSNTVSQPKQMGGGSSSGKGGINEGKTCIRNLLINRIRSIF